MARSGSRNSRGKGLRAHVKSNYAAVGKIPRGSGTTRTNLAKAASMPKVGPRNSGANSDPYVDSIVIL